MIDDPVTWTPPMDFYEMDNNYVLNAEIPGVERKDLKIELAGSELIVKGERKFDSVYMKESYHRLEGHRGKFLRSFSLPEPVDSSRMQIDLNEGILQIVLPKISGDRNQSQRANR
jgi:HSP20 family protein